ncbi:toxin glutamine deamidase domain-containing protein [Micromonospora deserti]|uniref:toxin glutamine deamidase domain-containing protein n=1 Tax=Micromonospora deserti TaxID=2070366 RepID=UPI001EEA1590|nr:toxin glutamine deamidase domain-containing protein [Micromonospora deserti]
MAAAGEVRGGYGGVGAVAEAFDTAWRRVAEGDQAPLSVLLAVSTDLGRLVEECGCDIEGAKLEVWIELGILVVELLALAVAAVLTAGAASPAAAAAITATRMIVQQIFKRLVAQLARKSLKQGLKEATERAAKEAAAGGTRNLGRRAALGGVYEAGEEAGVSLATQAYQNSTGRRDGLDMTELGRSAVGGLAGGAVAPLAGLGRHATGRGARIGEHLGREMTGEVIADQAASLALGQGLTSMEDAARAAVSGARGSAAAQVDAALHARLDGQLSALAGAPSAPMDLGSPAQTSAGPGVSTPVADDPRQPPWAAEAVLAVESTAEGGGTDTREERAGEYARPSSDGLAAARTDDPAPDAGSDPLSVSASTAAGDALSQRTAAAEARPTPTLSSVMSELPPVTAHPVPVASTGAAETVPTATAATHSGSSGAPPTPSAASPPPISSGAAPALPGVPPATAGTASGAEAAARAVAGPHPPSLHGPHPPETPAERSLPGPREGSGPPRAADPPVPLPRTPEWYAAMWAADRDAFERRRYHGHFEFQRTNYEDNRRRDTAARLRRVADRSYDEARWLIGESQRLAQAGEPAASERYLRDGRDRERWCHQQRDLAEAVLAGSSTPAVVAVVDEADFRRINDDVGDLAPGAVETADRSALTRDDVPPPIDRTRRYGEPGGLRPPLALHQTDVERRMPRDADGTVTRTADPRRGGWFRLMNDGGPRADPTRGINCIDCTLSLFDTWVHGRPRVAAPRTFDAYEEGDINRPLGGECDGPARIEDVTGGRFQRLCEPEGGTRPAERRQAVDAGYRNLHDQLLLGGHGSFAFVINHWEGGGSHIWVALNQNGTVLYLDPQSGEIDTRPLYPHHGFPNKRNAVDADVLVLGPDGRPMPLAGLRRGLFSQRPDLPEYPPAEEDQGYGEPYINRLHLLAGPGSAGVPGTGDAARNRHEKIASSDVVGQLSLAERAVLAGVRDRAVAAADEVEDVLAAIGRRVGEALHPEHPVQLRDQEFRVKSLESLARKYADEAEVLGMSVEEFGEGANDVLRFCLVMPGGERYRDAVEVFLAGLIDAGYSVRDDACKNFWRVGNRFYGFNCTVRSPGGTTFEVQLHTESSREAWLRTHEAYEILRSVSAAPERRLDAFLRMLVINREFGMPRMVPPGLSDRFPPKDGTFAKWISVNRSEWREYRWWLDVQNLSFRRIVEDHGLTVEDFPISPGLLSKLERADVDLLCDLPGRRENQASGNIHHGRGQEGGNSLEPPHG